MANILVVAPHPDDETLACGGSLLRHKQEGDEISWLIMTRMYSSQGFAVERIQQRAREIEQVTTAFDFAHVMNLDFPCMALETVPLADMVQAVSYAIKEVAANTIYCPYPGDIHSDHRIVFDVVSAASKQFRQPSVQRLLCYEAISETDYAVNPDINSFRPNVFINISDYLTQKLAIMQIYDSEIKPHPFPRSEASIRALATLRGAQSGFHAAESFMLIKEYF